LLFSNHTKRKKRKLFVCIAYFRCLALVNRFPQTRANSSRFLGVNLHYLLSREIYQTSTTKE